MIIDLNQARVDFERLHADLARHVEKGTRMFVHLTAPAELALRREIHPQPLEDWLAELDPPVWLE